MMKSKKQRILVIFLSLVLILAGCGKANESDITSTDVSTTTENDDSGEEVVIKYFTSRAPTDDTIVSIQEVVDQYNEEGNNVKLIIDTAADRSAYEQKLRTLVASDQMPDLFDIDANPYCQELGNTGRLVDMESFLKEIGAFDKYIPVSIEYQRLPDGRIYTLPLEFTTEMTWYNADIFNEYNLSAPKTMDDFLNVCKVLKENGVTPIAIDGVDGWPLMRYVAMTPFRMTGNQFLTDMSNGNAKMSDEPGVRTAEFIAEVGQYFQTGFSSTDYTTAKNIFLDGKAAMYGIGTWELQNFLPENLPEGLNVDYFYMPMIDGAATSENEYWAFGGIGLACSAAGFNDDVKDFVTYLVENYDEKYFAKLHFPPKKVQVAEDADYPQLFLDIMADQAEFGQVACKPWDVLLPADVNSTLSDNLVALAMGELSVEEFVSNIDDSLEENIK